LPNYKCYTEKDLLLLASQGSEAAFAELFHRYKDKLYGYAVKITANPQQAQDMVQDAFLKLWKNKAHLNTINNLDAFVFKTIQNQAINHFKRTARENLLLVQIEQQSSTCESSTETASNQRAVQHAIHDAVQHLPPQQHLVFKLSKEQGLKLDEIASTLNISRNTVKNHLAVAIKTVREQVRMNLEIEQLPLLLILLHLF